MQIVEVKEYGIGLRDKWGNAFCMRQEYHMALEHWDMVPLDGDNDL